MTTAEDPRERAETAAVVVVMGGLATVARFYGTRGEIGLFEEATLSTFWIGIKQRIKGKDHKVNRLT